MPLHVPVPPELIAADVWAHVTRLLTNPAAAQDLLNMQVGISSTATGRAALLDHITAARLAELDPANLPGDVDILLARLTAARALLLDNLNNPQLLDLPDLSTFTAARIAYLDYINNSEILNLPNVKIMEHELGFSSIEALNSIAVVSTDTTELAITVTIPSGAHIIRAYLISLITAMNNTANVQTIDVAVKGRVSAGAWRTYFNQNNCMGVIPLIGATAYLTSLQNVGPTASVADDRIVTDANLSGDPPTGTFGFKCTIGQDSADEVRYTTQYILIVTYRMS